MGAPDRHVGMEHEYKWYLGAPSDGGPGDQELLSSVQPPPGYRVAERWVSTQSNVYFDDAARGLSADDIAVTLVLSGGSPAGAVWLTCKDTLRSQRGRRDALEVEQRLDRQRLGADLDDPNLLPLLYLRRRGHGQPLDAYATARQRRQKLRVASDDGRVLLLSFDRVEFGPARGPTSRATRWLEIETGCAAS